MVFYNNITGHLETSLTVATLCAKQDVMTIYHLSLSLGRIGTTL